MEPGRYSKEELKEKLADAISARDDAEEEMNAAQNDIDELEAAIKAAPVGTPDEQEYIVGNVCKGCKSEPATHGKKVESPKGYFRVPETVLCKDCFNKIEKLLKEYSMTPHVIAQDDLELERTINSVFEEVINHEKAAIAA